MLANVLGHAFRNMRPRHAEDEPNLYSIPIHIAFIFHNVPPVFNIGEVVHEIPPNEALQIDVLINNEEQARTLTFLEIVPRGFGHYFLISTNPVNPNDPRKNELLTPYSDRLVHISDFIEQFNPIVSTDLVADEHGSYFKRRTSFHVELAYVRHSQCEIEVYDRFNRMVKRRIVVNEPRTVYSTTTLGSVVNYPLTPDNANKLIVANPNDGPNWFPDINMNVQLSYADAINFTLTELINAYEYIPWPAEMGIVVRDDMIIFVVDLVFRFQVYGGNFALMSTG